MTEPLTDRQEKILSFIERSIQDQGYPPTIREIGEQMGIRSTNGVNDHLKALERKGFLKREGLKSRALRPIVLEGLDDVRVKSTDRDSNVIPAILPMRGATVEVPILGRVAAGSPIHA